MHMGTWDIQNKLLELNRELTVWNTATHRDCLRFIATKVVEQLDTNQSAFEHTTAMMIVHVRPDSRAFNTSLT